jgi:hypothetical protein
MRGGHDSGLTHDQAVESASAELEKLKVGFAGWLDTQVVQLRRSAAEAKTSSDDAPNVEAVYRHSSDIRDVAAPMDFPLAGFVADNLCRIIELTRKGSMAYPSEMVDCHVGAITLTSQARYRGVMPSDQPALIEDLNRSYAHFRALASRGNEIGGDSDAGSDQQGPC